MFENQELVPFGDTELTVWRDADGNGWISNPEAARGYGYANGDTRRIDKMRRETHVDELVEGVHYTRVTPQGPNRTLGNDEVFWSLRGLVRLGNWVRTSKGKEFRDAAEDVMMRELTGATTGPTEDSMSLSNVLAMIRESNKPLMAAIEHLGDIKRDAEVAKTRVGDAARWAVAKEHREADFERRLSEVEDRMGLPAAAEVEWVRARVFCKEAGLPPETAFTNPLGRRARAIGTREGLSLRPVFDSEFGSVNTWPRWVWEQAASEMGGGTVTRIS